MNKTRVVTSSLCATAFPLAAVGVIVPPAAADAQKAGTADFSVSGVPYNADSGQVRQTASYSGPFGDTSCRCYEWSWAVCHSWQIHGYYLSAWRNAEWTGKASSLTFVGGGSARHNYDADNGLETACNAAAVAVKAKAEGLAALSAKSFHSLGTVDASGSTSAAATVPFSGISVTVPLSQISTQGRGDFTGSDVSWQFSYTGHAYSLGVKLCNNCVRASGQSLA